MPRLLQDSAPIHPLRLAHEINEFIGENTLYIGDGGDVVTFSGGVVQPKAPGLWMDPGPLGTLGVGVPFALAAKQARPDLEVVCLFGDGAFSLTGWDFETMVRFNLPFIGVVGNNSHMNQIRYGQIQKYGVLARRDRQQARRRGTTTCSRRCSAVTARRSATRARSPRRCSAHASRASRR